MTTFLFISIIFLLCFIVLLKFFFEYQERKHETELQYEKYCTTILVAKERATTESDLYRELLLTRENDNRQKFEFMQGVIRTPTLFSIPQAAQENAVQTPLPITAYQETPTNDNKFVWRKGSENAVSSDRYTTNSEGITVEIGGTKFFAPYPQNENVRFGKERLYVGKCKNDNKYFFTIEPSTNFCSDTCKNQYHKQQ